MGLSTDAALIAVQPPYVMDAHNIFMTGWGVDSDTGQPTSADNYFGTGQQSIYGQLATNTSPYISQAAPISPGLQSYGQVGVSDPATRLAAANSAAAAVDDWYDWGASGIANKDHAKEAYTEYMAEIATALNVVGIDLSDETGLDDEVDGYESATANNHFRAVGAFLGSMCDINGMTTSSAVIGLGMLESDRNTDLRSYRRKLWIQLGRDRNAQIIQGAAQVSQLLMNRIESKRGQQNVVIDTAMKSAVAEDSTQIQYNKLAIDAVDWQLNRVLRGMGSIGAISGVPTSPRGPSEMQNFLSAAMSTVPEAASMGMSIGGPVGGAVGAGLGLLVSYMGAQ